MENKGIKKKKKKWLIALAIVILVPITLIGALSLPFVQTFIAKQVASHLSKELNAQVTIEKVRITFSLNALAKGLSVDDQKGNNLFKAKEILVDVKKLRFRKKSLEIKKILFKNLTLNAKKYEGEDLGNYQFLLDYFSAQEEEEAEQNKWSVSVDAVELIESEFSYHNINSEPTINGFDPSNFSLQNLSFHANNLFLRNDSLAFDLQSLTFTESEFLKLNSLTASFLITDSGAEVKNLSINTDSSQLSLDALFEFEENGTEPNFFEDVVVDISINKSVLDLKELGYVISSLYGIEGPITLEGNFKGKPSNLRGSDLSISNGKGSNLKGNFHLTGLPHLSETFFMVTAQELKTSIREISSFRLPDSSPTRFVSIPSELLALGQINFKGKLTGFLNDFVAFGNFRTSIGQITTDILVRQGARKGDVNYSGTLITTDFDLGKIARFDKLGKISMDASIKGRGLSIETASVDMTGLIKHLDLFDYHYENIAISGDFSNRRFNGALEIADPNLVLDFKGIVDFEDEVPAFNFNASLENANLTLLNLYQREEPFQSILSGSFKINADASGLDDWIGKATINGLIYEERLPEGETSAIFQSSYFELENKAIDGNQKQISLYSDFVDATMTGIFRFDRVGPSIESFINKYLPAIFTGQSPAINDNSFANTTFQIDFKETNKLTDIFLPILSIGDSTTIKGRFGKEIGNLNLEITFPELSIAGNKFYQGSMIANQDRETYKFAVEFEKAEHSENLFLENFRFGGYLANNSISSDLRWNNTSTVKDNYGNIVTKIDFIDNQNINAKILPSYVVVNNSNWFLDTDNQIKISPSRIEVSCVELQGESYSMVVDGIVGPALDDILVISLDEIDVKSLWYLVDEDDFDFGGTISGLVSLSGLLNSTGVQAGIKIDDFEFNNVIIGDLELTSYLDKINEAYRISMQVTNEIEREIYHPFKANGSIYTGERDQNFDLLIELHNLDLDIWERYLGGVASQFSGKSTGRLQLGGPFDHVTLLGRARISNGLIEVAPLNTVYEFSNDMILQKDGFVFNNIRLIDKYGNTGTLTGSINHVAFGNWGLDLNINMVNMLALDLPQEWTSEFFGTAFATGNARITTPNDEITVDVTARTSRGTQLFFPIQQTELLLERNFITFISPEVDEIATMPQVEEDEFITLNLDIEVTPDAELQVVLDPRTGELIRGRCLGNLKVNIDPSWNFSIFGDVTIEEGEYLFKLQDILSRRFRIEPGGTITWYGHPLDAEVNIKAMYQLKATLYELFADFADVSDAYRRRVPVDVNLYLTEKLYPSTLTFDINIPGAGEEINRKLEEIISTEQEMTNQVFALLVFQRFIPAGSGLFDASLLGSSFGVGTTTELLTSQINNWLSQISRYFDIGLSYRPGDNITGQEVEVALSTRLLDDRLTIDGSFGYAANNPYMQRTSNIIGDVNVEYKLNPEGNWRLKAFNRTNTFDIENIASPYTQGIGVFFRKEFNRLSELFRERSRELSGSDIITLPNQDDGDEEDANQGEED